MGDTSDMTDVDAFRSEVLQRCQDAVPSWRGLGLEAFEMDDPKGFSSVTIGVRCTRDLEPAAVLYRQLEGKEIAKKRDLLRYRHPTG